MTRASGGCNWGIAAWLLWLGVVASTLAPFDFGGPPRSVSDLLSIDVGPDLSPDVLGNILLFVPLGFTLAGYLDRKRVAASMVVAAVVGVSLGSSYTIEVLQQFLPSRFASLSDVLSNGAGGALGFVAYALWSRQSGRLLVAVSIIVPLVAAVPIQWSTTVNNYWDEALPLVLGNERNGRNAWSGTVFDVMALDRPLADDEVLDLYNGSQVLASLSDSVIASYDLTRSCPCDDQRKRLPTLVEKSTGEARRAGDETRDAAPQWLQTDGPASELVRRVKRTSKFTLVVTAVTASTNQNGPLSAVPGFTGEDLAALLDLSGITLGQNQDDLLFRLRLPLTGPDGNAPSLVVPDVFSEIGKRHLVFTWDGMNLAAYVDGRRSLHGIRFGIGAAAFAPLIGRDTRLFFAYDGLFYALVFAPLGILVGVHAPARMKGLRRWVVPLTAIAAYSLFFEGTLVILAGRVFSWSNILLSLVCAAAGLATREIVRARAVGGVSVEAWSFKRPRSVAKRGSGGSV